MMLGSTSLKPWAQILARSAYSVALMFPTCQGPHTDRQSSLCCQTHSHCPSPST